MKNSIFNKRLLKIYEDNSSNQGFIEAVGKLWVNNTLTEEQTQVLETVKNLADQDCLSNIEIYFLKENT